MAYTDPTTRATGDLITAAIYNTDLINNLKALHGAPSACVTRSTNQSITNGTETDVSFTAAAWTTDTMADVASHATTLVIATPGVYTISGYVSWADSTTGRRGLILYGAGNVIDQDYRAPGSDGSASATITGQAKLIAADAVKIAVTQSSGGSLNVAAARLTATWVSAG